ncbi:MAG: aminotransferase class I/II-fold pyridoxal phosphate-dependent enzyme, partial [Candidatus Xenobia bacterium]
VHDLVSTGLIEKHTKVIIDEYRRRRDCMLEALERNFPEGVTWTRPSGGMFLWVTLPEGTDATTLLESAIEQKIAFVPGTHFYAQGGSINTMRLNFSNSTPARIREGIARLARVFKQTRKAATV